MLEAFSQLYSKENWHKITFLSQNREGDRIVSVLFFILKLTFYGNYTIINSTDLHLFAGNTMHMHELVFSISI